MDYPEFDGRTPLTKEIMNRIVADLRRLAVVQNESRIAFYDLASAGRHILLGDEIDSGTDTVDFDVVTRICGVYADDGQPDLTLPAVAGTVFAGPASGAPAAPGFRALAYADIAGLFAAGAGITIGNNGTQIVISAAGSGTSGFYASDVMKWGTD